MGNETTVEVVESYLAKMKRPAERHRTYEEWAARRRELECQCAAAIDFTDPALVPYLADGLRDEHRRWGIVAVLDRCEALSFPDELLDPLIHAAVHQDNPSTARAFARVIRHHFGEAAGIDRLRRYLTDSPVAELVGADWALYHLAGYPPERHEFQRAMLRAFLRSYHPPDQAKLFPWLRPDPEHTSAEEWQRMQRAIRIARSHPDEFIRALAEEHLGNDAPREALKAARRREWKRRQRRSACKRLLTRILRWRIPWRSGH